MGRKNKINIPNRSVANATLSPVKKISEIIIDTDVGLFDVEIKANPEEIDDWKFIKPDDLQERIRNSKKDYTPWMKIEWEMLTASYKREIENSIGIKL